MKYYTEDHAWVEVNREVATIGITEYGAELLGTTESLEMPDEGDGVIIGDRIGFVNADSDSRELIAPVSGTVLKINEDLLDEPELFTEEPEGRGWLCRLTDLDDSELDDMMSEREYFDYLKSIG